MDVPQPKLGGPSVPKAPVSLHQFRIGAAVLVGLWVIYTAYIIIYGPPTWTESLYTNDTYMRIQLSKLEMNHTLLDIRPLENSKESQDVWTSAFQENQQIIAEIEQYLRKRYYDGYTKFSIFIWVVGGVVYFVVNYYHSESTDPLGLMKEKKPWIK